MSEYTLEFGSIGKTSCPRNDCGLSRFDFVSFAFAFCKSKCVKITDDFFFYDLSPLCESAFLENYSLLEFSMLLGREVL